MFPAVGALLPAVVVMSTAQAAVPLTFAYTDPTGTEATLELTAPFERTLEANLGKEVHRLTLKAGEDGAMTADLVTIRKGKETPARSLDKTLPSGGNSMSFAITWPSHKSSTLGGAVAKWDFRVTANVVNQAARSGKIRRDWDPAPHAEHTLPHVRVKQGGRLFATAEDTEPIAVWPTDAFHLGAEVLEQQGGRLKIRRVTDRDICSWPKGAPHVQLEGWVELADLGRVLTVDEVKVHPDGTAVWLYAGAPLERVGSDHHITSLGLVIPSTATVSDRFTPSVHPAAGEPKKRAPSTGVEVNSQPLLTHGAMLPIVDTSPDGALSEVILPQKCGRAVVDVANPDAAVEAVPATMLGTGGMKPVPATTSAVLTWPDGRPAGQMVAVTEEKASDAYIYRQKPQKNGRTCGVWSPDSAPPTDDNPGIELCWTKAPPPAPAPAEPSE